MARTTALTKIEATLYEPTKYKVIQGGMSAGKTYAIMTLIESYCGSIPEVVATVVGLTYGHLKGGAIRDFKNIMKESGRWVDDWWNISESTYTFPNGSILEFKSVDRMTSRGPRRDLLYVNEANGIDYETFDALAGRTRDLVIIDYNPSAEFWAHKELVKKRADNTSFLILTYEDNEALDEGEREYIEERKPAPGEEPSNWWLVYGRGETGSPEGNIYHGWIRKSAEEIRKNGELVRYGLDFGFGHPTGLVALYAMADGAVGVVEEIYEKGISSSKYPETLMSHNIDPSVLIVADSARPEIVADIKAGGFRIVPANKDAGSVVRGIQRVQERPVYYSGQGIYKEYMGYKWRTKRSTGEILEEPEKADDDLMDALRYAVDDYCTPAKFNF